MPEYNFFNQDHNLYEIEDFMRSIQEDVKKGMAYLALSLATIKNQRLYIEVAQSFKEYIAKERTYLRYKESIRLASIGEKYFTFQKQLEANNVMLFDHMSKIQLLDEKIVHDDPMIFNRIKHMTYKQLEKHIRMRKSGIYTYPDEDLKGDVSVKGASVYIGGNKVKGINLNNARENVMKGKRAIIIWVDDDPTTVRRVKRNISGVIDSREEK